MKVLRRRRPAVQRDSRGAEKRFGLSGKAGALQVQFLPASLVQKSHRGEKRWALMNLASAAVVISSVMSVPHPETLTTWVRRAPSADFATYPVVSAVCRSRRNGD